MLRRAVPLASLCREMSMEDLHISHISGLFFSTRAEEGRVFVKAKVAINSWHILSCSFPGAALTSLARLRGGDVTGPCLRCHGSMSCAWRCRKRNSHSRVDLVSGRY